MGYVNIKEKLELPKYQYKTASFCNVLRLFNNYYRLFMNSFAPFA